MANYAPNYTARYRVRYSVSGAVHTLTLRVDPAAQTIAGVSAAGAANVNDIFSALSSVLFSDFVVLGADAAVQDSDIFLPATTLPTAFGEVAANDVAWQPLNLSFVGRSSAGGRAIFHVYGVATNPLATGTGENDYRLTPAENTAIGNVPSILNTNGNTLANDGEQVTWYPYANIGFNAYWQRRRRRG